MTTTFDYLLGKMRKKDAGTGGGVTPGDLAVALALKEDVANKDTDVTMAANSDTKYASQKAVKTYIDGIIAAANAMIYKTTIDCSTNPNYPAADTGWMYVVSVAGKIGGASGVNVEAGDMLLCNTDGTVSGNQATVGANWNIIQRNIDGYALLTGATFTGAITATNLAGTNTGDETGVRIALLNHAAALKSALVDADEITGQDSASAFGLIRTTWTDVKAFLKTYFDTLYATIAQVHYIGTTSIAANRASAAQSLTGITSIDGSAATLTTPRNINGVAFNGSANITVPSDIAAGSSGNVMTSNGTIWTSAAPSGGGASQVYVSPDYMGTAIIGILCKYTFNAAKTLTSHTITVDSIPVGSNLIVNVFKNSTTTGNILSSTLQVATSDTLANGEKTVTITDSDAMVAGDYICVYLTSVGSTTAAMNPRYSFI